MMHPNTKNSHNFNFPGDRLSRLWALLEVTRCVRTRWRMCILAVKKAGRANNITIAKEWPILPFNEDSGTFSVKDDSGTVAVGGAGRIGGTTTESPDVTYTTPISIVLNVTKSHGFLGNVYIKSAQSGYRFGFRWLAS
ncbi:unnamed protein product [Rhizoctonia solani]|uniref:Uncharacterized protein n=1 Tax=Rhizoctonia solani TaxID=456999 RepID=A0A8H3HSE7_9AGAM|nr:unnamed protein product [Rhizoctonia solani]